MYEQALLHHPKHGEALYKLAVAHGEARQLRKAALMYEMTLVVSPDCAEAHNNLGVIHRELNNYPKAMQCYMAALQIRPDFPQALNNVAVIYTSQANHDFSNLLLPVSLSKLNKLVARHASVMPCIKYTANCVGCIVCSDCFD